MLKKLIQNSKLIINNSTKKAFSLMELMIVISIIGIMTSIILIYPNRAEKQVEGAAREIAAMIREIQNNALTGKMPSSEEIPCSFSIRFYNGSNELKVVRYKDLKNSDTGCGYDSNYYDQEEYSKIFKNIKYDDDTTGWQCSDSIIRFAVPFGTVGWCRPDDSSSGKIKLTSANDSEVAYTICVYKTGRVTENKGNVVCP